MKPFLDKDFLLNTVAAQNLYNQFAAGMPIIDYHNHLSAADIAYDRKFSTITELWLNGDHYKWRAMRANGIGEYFITGDAGDEEKFFAWASTVPLTIRNPLYHWTHLELQRYFGIDVLLDETSAKEIYDTCNALLQTNEYSVRNMLRKMKVETLCTTDDPCDDLRYHKQLQQGAFDIRVLPSFRPDNIIAVEKLNTWREYFNRLSSITVKPIKTFDDFIDALKKRHDYFAASGCCTSDHGGEGMYSEEYAQKEVTDIFEKILQGHLLCPNEIAQFKSAVLYELALLDHEKGWVQQWHLGALRNTNSRLLKEIGIDAGVDSIGDFNTSGSMAAFLDKLDSTKRLSKTIVYNLNPADNELFATMMGNFQDDTAPGKMQYGPAWWFLDQKDGMEKQINTLSNMGLLSRFIGMTTDSRSFMSFPRHEYFRRILCNLIGAEIENGELPNDLQWLGKIIQDICYHNAKIVESGWQVLRNEMT